MKLNMLILLTFVLFSCGESKKEQTTEVPKESNVSDYPQLIIGKWKHEKMLVIAGGEETLIDAATTIESYMIFEADGVYRNGNDSLGFTTSEYKVVKDELIIDGALQLKTLNADEMIQYLKTEDGEVYDYYRRVKQ